MNTCIKYLELQIIHSVVKWILILNVPWTYVKWEVVAMNLCGNVSIEIFFAPTLSSLCEGMPIAMVE